MCLESEGKPLGRLSPCFETPEDELSESLTALEAVSQAGTHPVVPLPSSLSSSNLFPVRETRAETQSRDVGSHAPLWPVISEMQPGF